MSIWISAEDLAPTHIYPMIGHSTDLVWSSWFGKVKHGDHNRQSDGGHQYEYGQTNTCTYDESIDLYATWLDNTKQPNQKEQDGQRIRWDHLPSRTFYHYLYDGYEECNRYDIARPVQCTESWYGYHHKGEEI